MTTQLPQPDPSLVDRVRKLLDKAARTDNEHEADVFARKAAELVARHRIDPARLAESTREAELSLIEIAIGRGAYVRARLALLGGIADAHDVRMVFRSTSTGSVAMLAGFRDDLDVVEVMYTSLHQQAAAQMSALRRGTGAATQRHRRAFLFGFADRVGELLAEARTSVEADDSRTEADRHVTTLALRERDVVIEEHAAASFGRVRTASRPKGVSPAGYAGGVVAANRADVGRSRLGGKAAIGRGRK